MPGERTQGSPLHAIKRLRKRMADLTLTLSLEPYQRAGILREIDEWAARELGRSWIDRVK
jgi:hypothetical protein